MPSVEPVRLTDQLWLAAHDGVGGRPCIAEWPLGVGLAAGLLGELIHGGCLTLHHDELVRTGHSLPEDPALQPLLGTMAAEEQRQTPVPVPPRPRQPVEQHEEWDESIPSHHGTAWADQVSQAHAWQARPADVGQRAAVQERSPRHRHMHEQTQHHRPGHDLREWLSYLAYERRAESLVIDRLARAGLVQRRERRRLLGGATMRYVPCDSAVSGSPACKVRIAVQAGRGLSPTYLLLAGLFLATGLHEQALAPLSRLERSQLADELRHGLDDMSRELLRAADAAIGEAAMR